MGWRSQGEAKISTGGREFPAIKPPEILRNTYGLDISRSRQPSETLNQQLSPFHFPQEYLLPAKLLLKKTYYNLPEQQLISLLSFLSSNTLYLSLLAAFRVSGVTVVHKSANWAKFTTEIISALSLTDDLERNLPLSAWRQKYLQSGRESKHLTIIHSGQSTNMLVPSQVL